MNVEAIKRVGTALFTIALIALNKKLGLDLGAEEIAGIAATSISYVVAGTWKANGRVQADAAVEAARVQGQSAAEQVKTLDDSLSKIDTLLKERA